MSPSPVIKGRPNLAPTAFPEVERYKNPIEDGYSKTLIKFDLDSFPCKKFNINNRKLSSIQKKLFGQTIEKLQQYTWGQASNGSKSIRYRLVSPNSLTKANPPPEVEIKKIPFYICFKYNGTENVFGGFFEKGLHYVVWVGQQADDIYKHPKGA